MLYGTIYIKDKFSSMLTPLSPHFSFNTTIKFFQILILTTLIRPKDHIFSTI